MRIINYAGLVLVGMLFGLKAEAQTPSSPPVAQPAAAASTQRVFSTPRAAVDALLAACKDNDTAALVAMMGEKYGAQLEKVDDAEERQHRSNFYERAQAALKIEEEGDAKAVILIGRELWPVPIPLVKDSTGWRFDTEAGLEEMQARRIGANELAAIEACYEFVRAQIEYAAVDRDADEVREYAQRILSTPGKQDGLYWDIDPEKGEAPSPFEAFLPDEITELKTYAAGAPYMGYHYRVMTGQGANPPGGKYDYVINGNMIAGFALIAWPADYRASGVMTFVISHQGKLHEKDLGPETAKLIEVIKVYDPDKTWNPTMAQ